METGMVAFAINLTLVFCTRIIIVFSSGAIWEFIPPMAQLHEEGLGSADGLRIMTYEDLDGLSRNARHNNPPNRHIFFFCFCETAQSF